MILSNSLWSIVISSFLLSNCRYLTSCSEYFIDSLKLNGFFKGSVLGFNAWASLNEDIGWLGAGITWVGCTNYSCFLKK